MRDFKQILNNIAFYAQSEVMGSCCEASNFWRPTNWHIRAIQDLYVDYADRNSPSDKVEFKRIFTMLTNQALGSFMHNFCKCKHQIDSTSNFTEFVGFEEFELADNRPTPLNSEKEKQCLKVLNSLLKNLSNPTQLKEAIFNITKIQNGNRATVKFIENFAASIGYYIDSARGFAETVIRTDNLTNFFDDNCKLMRDNPQAYREYNNEAFRNTIAPYLSRIADMEWYYITNKTSDIESLTADCAPSTGDESVISLLGALGVGAAGVTVVGYLSAIFKGNVKKCADKRQAAKKATTQLLALLGAGVGSFSATQVSEAEIVDRVEDIIIKDCEGRLPYSCGEGGFEGPDDGDESGEVDAPDGGGIGGIG